VRYLQWSLGLVVLGAAIASTLWLLSPGETARLRREHEEYEKRLRQENEDLQKRRADLEQAVSRLTGQDRVAEVYVVEQVKKGEVLNGQPAATDVTVIEFVEIDREGHPLPSKRFIINDSILHFDALVLKFDPEYVAEGDALRGKSLALFRRIYGESQAAVNGFPIDPSGDVPNIYRVNPQPTAFELQLWSRFWELASDPNLAAKNGVRIAQGEVKYVPVRKGQVWTLTIENNGGMNVKLRRSNADQTSRPSLAPSVR
jgi:hypothetical protein